NKVVAYRSEISGMDRFGSGSQALFVVPKQPNAREQTCRGKEDDGRVVEELVSFGQLSFVR
ncbi:hypothetical protein, partial [Klebsiella pneumoniae]|uniref:hypothetical protein n=1 Tax=Klebsiella pneumoniae TaxID=573 RepID=UPI003F52628E